MFPFFLCLLPLALSCGRGTFPGGGTPAERLHLSFSVSDVSGKAMTATVLGTLIREGFAVTAFTDGLDGAFLADNVQYSDSTGCFRTAGHYWLPDRKTMDFYAVYPACHMISPSPDGPVLSCSDADTDTDIVVAETCDVRDVRKEIPLVFRHIKSGLSLAVKGVDKDVEYSLDCLELAIPEGGTYSYAEDAWTAAGFRKITLAGSDSVPTESRIPVPTEDALEIAGPLSVIPDYAAVKVGWTCSAGDIIIASYMETATLKLIQGHLCSVTLLLSNNGSSPLDFIVEVSLWEGHDVSVEM